MTFSSFLLTISSTLVAISFFPYIYGVIYQGVKPHIFTWVVWFISGLLAFVISFREVGLDATPLFFNAFFIAIILGLSFKFGSSDITKTDKLFLALAVVSIGAFIFVEKKLLSLVLATIIDVLGFIPTIRKAFFYPETEAISMYILFIVAYGLAILSLDKITLESALYIGTIAVMCFILSSVVLFSRWVQAR